MCFNVFSDFFSDFLHLKKKKWKPYPSGTRTLGNLESYLSMINNTIKHGVVGLFVILG